MTAWPSCPPAFTKSRSFSSTARGMEKEYLTSLPLASTPASLSERLQKPVLLLGRRLLP